MAELRRSTRSATQQSTQALTAATKKRVNPDAKGKKAVKKAKEEPKEEKEAPKEEPKKEQPNGERDGDEDEDDSELEVGDAMPAITVKDENDNDVDLQKVVNSTKYVVIFAYPKANTPGCTRQAKGFRDDYEFYKEHGVKVYGLSADLPKSQTSFISKYDLPYPLLLDPKRVLVGVLGAKKTPQKGVKRSHWVFADGKLADKRVTISPEKSVEEAKKWIEKAME